MVYKRYGKIFHLLRKQSGLSVASFSSIGISKSAVSKFERGETMMSFEKVCAMLQILGITLEEYERLLNNNIPGDIDFLCQKITKSIVEQDLSQLLKLSKSAKDLGFTYLHLGLEAARRKLTEEEIDKITDYLEQVVIWGLSEFLVFYLSLENLRMGIVFSILRPLLDLNNDVFSSYNGKIHLATLGCKAASVLALKGYREQSKFILLTLEKHDLVNTMYLRNVFNVSRGFWIYRFRSITKGKQIMEKSFDDFDHLATPSCASYYRKQYDTYIKLSH